MTELEELRARVEALEAQAGPGSGVSALQPNVLTIAPDGSIGADLTGHLSAEGVDLPESTSGAFTALSAVDWRDPSGEIREWVQGFIQGTIRGLTLNVPDQANGNANGLSIGAPAAGGGYFQVNVSGIVQQILLNNLGASHWLRVPKLNPGRRWVSPLFDTGVLGPIAQAGGQAGSGGLDISLFGDVTGTAGKITALGNIYDGFFSGLCTWRMAITNGNPATAQIVIGNPGNVRSDVTAGWRGVFLYCPDD